MAGVPRYVVQAFRNVRRSFITIFSIAVGTAALACFGAFISFTFEGLRETTIRSELGHLQIYAEGYLDRRLWDPGSAMITDPDAVEASVRGHPGVVGVSRRVGLMGLGGKEGGAVVMQITGVDVAREAHFADAEIITRGRGLRASDHAAGVVGEELARGLALSVGEWVTVLTSTHEGMISAFEFEVVEHVLNRLLAATKQSGQPCLHARSDLEDGEAPRSKFPRLVQITQGAIG